MVTFKNDLDTFCRYIAFRPPNIDYTVEQHMEDRFLEKSMRGIYYVASYRHQPDDGEAITIALDHFCGRIDPDDETGDEAVATVRKSDEINQSVLEAVAAAGGSVRQGAMKYTGELVSRTE